jgi:hypothetical protein
LNAVIGPNFLKDSIEYSEQLGINLQLPEKKFDKNN